MSEANGFSGFRQVPMGFDKNQVNEYITDLRKKMLAMEADMKANTEKMEEAQKLADEADERIKAAVAVESDKVSDLTMQLNREKERGDNFTAKVNELKKQLEAEKQKMTDMLKSGKGVSAEAKRAYAEILDKANADADDIIKAANEKADAIVAEAEQRRNEINTKLDEFMDALRAQVETINTSYGAISASAGSLLGAAAPKAIAMPDLRKPEPVAVAPVVEEPAAEPVSEPAVAESSDAADSLDDIMSAFEAVAASVAVDAADEAAAADEPTESIDDVMAALEAIAAPKASAKSDDKPKKEKKPEPEPEKADEDSMPALDIATAKKNSAPATFDDAWGGSELAQTIYNSEMNGGVPLVNPDAKDIFGQDLFGMGLDMSDDSGDEMSSDLGGFDLSDNVDEVKPLDTSDHSEASFNKGFDNDLLAQTMNSSSLASDADEDLLAAVKAAEAAFAVQPNISMDDNDEPEAADTAEDLMKSLLDAEAALNPTSSASAASDPWADLQAQLDAMDLAGIVPAEEPTAEEVKTEEAEIPSPDDASIWDLGGATSSSDDDDDMMSGDFGGFGF